MPHYHSKNTINQGISSAQEQERAVSRITDISGEDVKIKYEARHGRISWELEEWPSRMSHSSRKQPENYVRTLRQLRSVRAGAQCRY